MINFFLISPVLTARCRLALFWPLGSILLLAGLVGCSSVPSYGNTPQSLTVHISPNNSKQFTYLLGRATELSARALVQAPRYVPDRRDYEKLQRRTAYVVAATGYCRDGYMELDFRLNMQQQWLRGECKESATEVDIKTFGDQTQVPLNTLTE
ncbi:hypothetical protein [Gilvimarinus polysaccharolyticus]|uniref:hypothetical protein n=1 Tax=Gilvimarinus polysaccharolyticus TaxID=863921 RepID=UPI0006732447|nr:hypothetical protein [Gilvimarinus polysaccharolyticus]